MKYSKAFTTEYRYLAQVKKVVPKATIHEYINLLKNLYYERIKYDARDYAEARTNATFNVFEQELLGQCVHFYIKDPSLIEFLENCPVKDIYFYKALQFDTYAIDKELVRLKKTDTEDVSIKNPRIFTFCLHIPGEDYARTFNMVIGDTEDGETLAGMQAMTEKKDNNGNHYQVMSSYPFTKDKKEIARFINNEPNIKLGVNFIYYCHAFPECVIDGLPKGERLEYGFNNKKRTISTSEKIKVTHDESGRVITPHLRRGHFRYLGSNYFTKKQGQTIFIDACAVKGKNNKTVIKHKN